MRQDRHERERPFELDRLTFDGTNQGGWSAVRHFQVQIHTTLMVMGDLSISPSESDLIIGLVDRNTREQSLSELAKHREAISNLAEQLWTHKGVLAALIFEVISIYPLLSPPSLTSQASTRVCNVLALFQCMASHEKTRHAFLAGTHLLSRM